MACGLPACIRLLLATMRSSTKVVIRSIPISDAGGQCKTKYLSWTRKRVVVAHYKKDDLLNCWTSSSDISGYHTDFHEGHGTIGAGQGRGMAGEQHGHSMLCVNQPLSTLKVMGFCLDCCPIDHCTSHYFLKEPSNRFKPLILCNCLILSHSLDHPEQLIMPDE